MSNLRSGFVWTVAGNVFYAASQWAILSLIAKLGDARMLGEYAYAVSLVFPIAMLAHLNLRAVLATDAPRSHPFGDYLAIRRAANLALLVAAAILALLFGVTPVRAAVIFLVAFMFTAENSSDLYYGAMQRRDRLDQVARSMILRGSLSVIAASVALAWTSSLLVAVAALALVRLLMLLLYDRSRGAASEDPQRRGPLRQLFRTALPLGAVLMLVSLTANLPRYVIEHYLGSRELGAYAAAASFLTVGTTMLNALGQSVTAPLSRAFAAVDLHAFRRLALWVGGLAVGLGLAGVAAAYLMGGFVLSLVYRPEYAVYRPLLIQIMAASIVLYLAVAIGYLITSARSFTPQLPLLAVAALTSAITAWTLVPVIGLAGAAAAIALAALVQCAGGAWILRRTFEARL